MEQAQPAPDRIIAALRENPLFDALSDEKLAQIAEMIRAATQEQVAALLGRVPLFQGLRDEDLQRVQQIAASKLLEPDEVLFQEGDPGDAFYVVLRGAVDLVKRAPAGKEERLATRRSGEAFGEMSLLNEKPRSASARAVEKSHLLMVSRDAFRQLLGGDTLAVRLLQGLANALWAMDVRFAARQREQKPADAVLTEISRVIQRGILPRTVPRVPGYEIAARTNVRENGKGSTVWHWFQLADGRPVLVSLDVKGEGLPAAHYLSMAQLLLREIGRQENEVGKVLQRANTTLATTYLGDLSQCIQCGLLALGDSHVDWVSAGRPAGALLRATGRLDELPTGSAALGLQQGAEYVGHRIALEPGEVVLVHSDLPEEVVRDVRSVVASAREENGSGMASQLGEAIEKAVGRLADGHDMTTIVVRRVPAVRAEADRAAAEVSAAAPDNLPEFLKLPY